jgi:hypothetical protein
MTRVTIAPDLAKSVFQLVVSEESGRISERKRLTAPDQMDPLALRPEESI